MLFDNYFLVCVIFEKDIVDYINEEIVFVEK